MKRVTANRILLICIVAATIAFMLPITRIGFIEDEALNSYVNGWIDWHHTTWLALYGSVVHQWIVNEGRLIPVNLASVYGLFHVTQNAFVVKSIQTALIALNVGTLAAVAKRLTGSWTFGLLSAACVALTLQVRFPVDPIAGFAPLLPLTMEFILLALAFQLAYQSRPQVMSLVCGVSAFTAAALSYEVTYAFVLLFWYLAWRRAASRRDMLLQGAAFALPLVVLVGLSLALRHAANLAGNDPYALVLAPGALVRTYAIQTLAALPFTFAVIAPIPGIGSWTSALTVRPLAALVFGTVFAVLVVRIVRGERTVGTPIAARPQLIDAVAIGALLWLLAGPMMSASPRWQHELVFGQSYLPVYFAYFGVALLIGAACAAAVQQFRTLPAAIAIAAIVGILTAGTYQFNRAAQHAYLPAWTEGRFALEEAMRDGMFDRVPSNATIVLDHSYPWDFEPPEPLPNSNVRYLFFMLLGKRYAFEPIDDAATTLCPALAKQAYCDLRKRNVFAYFSDNNVLVPGERWTRVLRIDGATLNGDGTTSLLSSSGTLAARGSPEARLDSDMDNVMLQSRRRFGDTLVATARSCTSVAAGDFPSRSGVTFGPGFYGAEQSGLEHFHWSMQHSIISIVSPESTAHVHLSTRLASYVTGTKVRIRIPHRAPETVALTPTGTPWSVEATIGSGVPFVIDFALEGKPYVTPADPRIFGFRAVDMTADISCGVVQ